MDHQTTIPSQLSPDTVPSVLASGADAAGGARRTESRGASNSLLGGLALALLLGLVIVLVIRLG
jgi:predicted lipid-binding transport protein (Tim44 family)